MRAAAPPSGAARPSSAPAESRRQPRIALAGPAGRSDRGSLASALVERDRSLAPGGWLRCVGYDDDVAGPLDRHALDALVPRRPVRVQHRSGALWVLNSAALALADVDSACAAGVERAMDGSATGRLYGLDAWLRTRIGGSAPDLASIVSELSSYGVTGVTDATPSDGYGDVEPLAVAARRGAPLRVVVMGGPALTARDAEGLTLGPVKIVIADHSLPSLEELITRFRLARRAGRRVAVHSVTLESLVLALAAWEEVGSAQGDRLEHGAVVPPTQALRLAELDITVVTQPSFVNERGDDYLEDVERRDLPHLYPCRSLLDAGVSVGFSTDAPFGHPDPWRAIAAAATRKTRSGRRLGADERIGAGDALRRFLTAPASPGGRERRVVVGAPAGPVFVGLPAPRGAAVPR